MAYTKYSLTPANNTAAPPDGAPEGMLPSAVNDTMRDMMSQIRDVGDGVRDGTYTMTAPKITGGTITGVVLTGNTLTNPVITGATLTTSAFNGTVGATTASTGAFTTLTSNGATTFTANTASTSTTTGTTVITGGLGVSGRVNAANFDGIVGANTAAAGSFTTINASTSITNAGLTSGRVTYAGASGLLSDSANFVYDSSERLIVGASSAAIGNRMEVVSNTGSQAIGIRGRVSDGAGVISWHPNASATEYARIQSDSNSALIFGTGSSGSERMRITSAGNVGIGTSSPSQPLTVNGVIASIGPATALSASSIFMDYNTTSNSGRFAAVGNTTGTAAPIYFSQYSSNASVGRDAMVIDSSGNVGIGTSSPQANLQVTSSAFPVLKVADGIGGGAVALGDSTVSNNYVGIWRGAANSISGGGFLNVQGNGIAFMSSDNVFGSASERMRIDSSGNLLVGTTTSYGGEKFTLDFTGSAQRGMVVRNTTSTTQDSVAFVVNSTFVGLISASTTGTTYNTISDYRLKENVVPMTGALAKVAQLKPVTYKWKIDGSDGQGFIAHELQAVVPECVTGEKDAVDADGKPKYQGVDTSFLVATLVSAIQEQQALIESLTTRLTALESK